MYKGDLWKWIIKEVIQKYFLNIYKKLKVIKETIF